MYTRIFALIIFSLFSITSYASDLDPKVKEYVDQLIDKSFSILKNDNLTIEQKMEKSEELMTQNMDLEWMSKFVLGRHRRGLSLKQINDFTKIYSVYVVKSYSSAVKSYQDQDLKVKNERKINNNEYSVRTLLVTPGMEPLRIEYIIRDLGHDNFKVFDIVIEGVSLISSHQSEFSSIISNEGFDSLIKKLNEKIKYQSDKI